MKTNYFITGWPLAFFVLAIFAACDKNDAGPKDNNSIDDLDEFVERNLEKVTADQGVAGTVIVEEGNCMPHVGEEPEPNPDCYQYPAERTIYIHEYTTNEQVTVDPDLNAPYAPNLYPKSEPAPGVPLPHQPRKSIRARPRSWPRAEPPSVRACPSMPSHGWSHIHPFIHPVQPSSSARPP